VYDKGWFYSHCVPKSGSLNQEIDYRPVIYVNGPQFYFNITKSAIFQDVIFDGINAFGEIHIDVSNPEVLQEGVEELAEESIPPDTRPMRLPYWPQRICEIATPGNFSVQDGNTVLIQLLKDALIFNDSIEEANSTFWNRLISGGYGQLVLRDLLSSGTLYDKAHNERYRSGCRYHRTSD
jgi:hypothetical protein